MAKKPKVKTKEQEAKDERERIRAAMMRAHPGRTSCLVCNGKGCKFCDERRLEEIVVPKWYNMNGRLPAEAELVRSGRHPLGDKLDPPEFLKRTCWHCIKCERRIRGGAVVAFHCRLGDRDVEISHKWRACEFIEEDPKLSGAKVPK